MLLCTDSTAVGCHSLQLLFGDPANDAGCTCPAVLYNTLVICTVCALCLLFCLLLLGSQLVYHQG